ncbi:peptidase inhibitor family I36 protein [Actinocrinis puniceicyclus]|uniref:Peptidase inhibitor family I36 protein n=1 Tax=Actinocrinis puniceicyclus TaxID=977794 RepID=A0A8J7WLC5_9ACTN|nr:peptidase inhibitor family I36 protein [Actinocrinis puniceicyclus]MBS2962960.1 peptidase inhibitor family I36 protein [Actinocrinis puniceicyclus]
MKIRAMATLSAATAALAIGLGFAVPTAANAATKSAAHTGTYAAAKPAVVTPDSGTSCTSGDLCVYYLQNFGGPVYGFLSNDANWTNNYFSNGATVNDNDESWWNNGTSCAGCSAVSVYKNINYGGGVDICLRLGQYVAVKTSVQDQGSSDSWHSSC